jgi:hypothetical protein
MRTTLKQKNIINRIIPIIRNFLLLVLLVSAPVFTEFALAQPPPPPNPKPIPIDSGLIVLIISGMIYGAVKLRKNEKHNILNSNNKKTR